MTTTNNVGHLSKHARSISVENDNNGNVLVSTPEMGVRKPTESLLFELANNLGTRDCHIDDDNGRKRMMRKNRIHKDKARRIILKASKSETDNSIPEKKSNLNKVVGGKGDA
ncbi:hypothetical protein SNEBB_009665 [Seison nebaliae]|nr:hypothetical protein SNEBB_009665 [Seison nebaliae]